MRPTEAEHQFRLFIRRAAKSPKVVSGADAVRLALDFYTQVRCEGCDLEEDGDMLLYQWGYSKVKNSFYLDITRQFILKGSRDDDGMSQLCFTLHFPVTEKLSAVDSSNHWCSSPAELEEFERFILDSEAYSEVKDLTTKNTELYWCGV